MYRNDHEISQNKGIKEKLAKGTVAFEEFALYCPERYKQSVIKVKEFRFNKEKRAITTIKIRVPKIKSGKVQVGIRTLIPYPRVSVPLQKNIYLYLETLFLKLGFIIGIFC